MNDNHKALLREISRFIAGELMAEKKTFNPFTDEPAPKTVVVNPVIDQAITDFASYLKSSAEKITASKSPLSKALDDDAALDYLTDLVDEAFDQETWSTDECCRLAAMFFILGAVRE